MSCSTRILHRPRLLWPDCLLNKARPMCRDCSLLYIQRHDAALAVTFVCAGHESCVQTALFTFSNTSARLSHMHAMLSTASRCSLLELHGLAGGLAVTAGGTSLCVWDMLASGRLLQRLSQHQKTVTCVALSPLAGPDSAAAPRMLSGSLDGHVKVCMLAIAVAP